MKINITFHIDRKEDEVRMKEVLKGLKMGGVEVVRAQKGELVKRASNWNGSGIVTAPGAVKSASGKRLSDAQKKEVVKLLQEGVSASEVAKKMGCSEPTVYILKTKARRQQGIVFPETPSRFGRGRRGGARMHDDDGGDPDLLDLATSNDDD